MNKNQYENAKSLNSITAIVDGGSSTPNPMKISLNFGTMNTIRKVTINDAIANNAAAHSRSCSSVPVASDFDRVCSCRRRASSISTSARAPVPSATRMAVTVWSGNSSEMIERAPERECPCSSSIRNCPILLAQMDLLSCSCALSDCKSVSPWPTPPASSINSEACRRGSDRLVMNNHI